MTRTAMPQLDSFDPEVLDAARDVAARAGVPLETWIASVVPQQQSGLSGNRRERRRLRAEQLDRPAGRPETATRADTRADTRAEARPDLRTEARVDPIGARPREIPAERPAPIAETYGEGIAALMSRLDGLDRTLDADRREAQIAEQQRLAEIEARIERALNAAPVQQVTERLGDIERRMSQLGDQVAAGRQPGRRTRPAAADIRSAVLDIRQRQRELSQGGGGDVAAQPADGGVVASMRQDLARRLEARTGDAATTAALSELQAETVRLRQSIDQLATSRDVGALEDAVTALASGLDRAQAGTDLATIAAPIEQIRLQVELLAEEVAEHVHARVAEDVRRLAERLDDVAATGPTDPDGQTLAALFTELDEIRQLITALADPERIQSLANSLQVVSAQVVQLQHVGAGPDLRPLLEEIRGEVKSAAPAALAEQVQVLAEKVDHLCALQDRSEPGGDAAQSTPVQSGEMASIHAMLHTLAEKVDEAGEHEGLDALEKQVMSLADRLDTPHGGDPALAGLERTMGDLLAQVAALREAAPSEAVVERAARNAVAQTLSGTGITADSGEIGLLRASLADMQARQAASDQRLGATLEGVQTALERLLVRLGPSDAVEPRGPSLGERLMSSASPEVTLAATDMKPAAGAETPLVADDLLEPGSGRPVRAPRGGRDAASRRSAKEAQTESVRVRLSADPGAESDIKTSFIAAARRAAQAAQAELAAEEPTERRDIRPAKPTTPSAAGEPGRVGRLRSELDRRRRPLLLGLAAIVLALGALQAVKLRTPEEPRPVVAASQAAPVGGEAAGEPAKVAAKTETGDAGKDASKEASKEAPKEAAKETAKVAGADGWKDAPGAKPPVADPTTTQALPNPVPAEARATAAKAVLPQVAGMNTLQADLGGVPAGLAKVKAAALEGDGTAVWDLASREAEGRGMPATSRWPPSSSRSWPRRATPRRSTRSPASTRRGPAWSAISTRRSSGTAVPPSRAMPARCTISR